MLSDQPGPREYLNAILVGEIGLSEKSAALLVEEHGELDVQRHAMCCLWMMDQGKVRVPPAWLTASLNGDTWNPQRHHREEIALEPKPSVNSGMGFLILPRSQWVRNLPPTIRKVCLEYVK